jgi:PH (Pleckstrin Homology) domain-containing protein/putative oligomerization/nucleic acid binding protein
MARYADSLLTEGETVVYRSRQHWLALIIRGRAGVAMIVLGIVLIVLPLFIPNVLPDGSGLRTIVSGAGLVILVIGLLMFVLRLWQWSNQDYAITNRRLLKVTGIFNKHSADSSLEKINDAILDQPVLGRMLNYGDLTILTAAEEAVDLYHMLRDPKTFKKTMLTQKHALETEFMYVGAMPPTPPLRAEAPPMAQSPAPSMTPPPAMAPAATMAPPAPAPAAVAPDPIPVAATDAPRGNATTDASLEVTQTLARLADLRDSGAVTPEEYEAKKQELLGRL